MNIEYQTLLLDKLKKELPRIDNIDFFTGKLGLAVSVLQFGSLNYKEDFYDFGSELLGQVFSESEKNCYLNYDTEIALLGYIVEGLKRNDILDIDTDETFRLHDGYIIDASSKHRFNLANYYQTICYCYYLASRFIGKKPTEDNFYLVQILILKLIEISTSLDKISKDYKTINKCFLIEFLFNLFIFSEFLIENSVCEGFASAIKDKILNIGKLIAKKSIRSTYHMLLIKILNDQSSIEYVVGLLRDKDAESFFKETGFSSSQAITIVCLLKSHLFSSEKNWISVKPQVLGIIKSATNQDKLEIPLSIGLVNGVSAYFISESDYGKKGFSEVVHLLSLFNITYNPVQV